MKRRQFLVGVAGVAMSGVTPAGAAEAKKVAMLWRTAEGAPSGADPRDIARQLASQSKSREEASRAIASKFEPYGFRLHGNLEILWFDFPAASNWRQTLPAIVSRMVAARPDCILVDGPVASFVVKATREIPVVTFVRDPVADGLARSIARPGGNVTGVHGGTNAIDAKTIEYLARAMPGLACVAVVGAGAQPSRFAALEAAGREAGLGIRHVDWANGQAGWQQRVTSQFEALRAARCTGAVLLIPIQSLIDETTRLALRHGIALAIFSDDPRDAEREGVLLHYGVGDDQDDLERRMAAIAARVLKGERPADIPFEGPGRYRLLVNLRTARRIGAKIPPEMMVLADRVID